MKSLRIMTLMAATLLGATALSGCNSNTGAAYKPGEKVKVGLICLHGDSSTYDANFMNAWKEAFEHNDKVIYDESCVKTDIAEGSACYDAAKALVKQGCNMIFADSFGHGPYMKQAAAEFPNVQFCHATGTDALTGGLNNLHNAFAGIYEGRYLAGYAAGLALTQGGHTSDEAVKVGYVGAFPYAEVKSGYTSWYLGLREVLPNATMTVEFTSSWYDETGEREKANSLINAGCILISQHADSMGAPSACQNHNPKIPNVTYNVSTQSSCPDTFVAYSAINWAPYFTAVTDAMYSGRVIEGEVGRNWAGSIKNNNVKFETTTNDAVLNAANRQLIEAKKQELINASNTAAVIWDTSKYTVTVTGSKNQGAVVDKDGHLTSYKADTTGDYVGDTEVVLKDGEKSYFSESSFRSAPYFDLDIDGITIA